MSVDCYQGNIGRNMGLLLAAKKTWYSRGTIPRVPKTPSLAAGVT